MFKLFKKREESVTRIDKITMDDNAKLNALLSCWENDPDVVFIFWFDDSLEKAETFFRAQTTEKINLLTAREASAQYTVAKTIIFAEHFPLREKEEDLYKKMNVQTVTIYSSLAEPLFKLFGGERIIQMMQAMGMQGDEVIEHKMISRSIANAQEKIAKKVVTELSASSQSSWLEKNLPAE